MSRQAWSGAEIRRVPKQDRSRQRVELILDATMQLIGERGIDSVTMLDIARRAGGPLASIYQYFPNKSAILAMLFERWCEVTRGDTASNVGTIRSAEQLIETCGDMLDRYVKRVRGDPAIQDLINAVLADKTLQHLDIEDSRWHARVLTDAARHLVSPDKMAQFERAMFLIAHLIGGLMRLVLAVSTSEGNKIIEDYKLLLRSHLAPLVRSQRR